MSENDLRAALGSDEDKEVVKLTKRMSLDHDKVVEVLKDQRHFDGFDGFATNGFLIGGDIVAGALTSLNCVGEESYCTAQCATAKNVIRKAFAEGGIYPAWGAVKKIGKLNERVARKELPRVYLADAAEGFSDEVWVDAGNDYVCRLTAIMVDWEWAHSE